MGVGRPGRVWPGRHLARPSGNLTGFSNISVDLTSKRLELLSEL